MHIFFGVVQRIIPKFAWFKYLDMTKVDAFFVTLTLLFKVA